MRTSSPRNPARSGFTLTEILVVLSIIVLIAALSIPAINVLTGSKSIDAATNSVSAMLARARGEALARQAPVGLAVFTDTSNDRVALAVVSYPLPWTAGTGYERGDVVYLDDVVSSTPTRNYFICHTAHTAGSGATNDAIPSEANAGSRGNRWSDALNQPAASFAVGTNTRHYPLDLYVSMIPEVEVLYLPPGIGAQVLNNARTTSTPPRTDRYLSASVIFFDGDGKLLPQSNWGVLFNKDDRFPSTPSQVAAIRSSRLGLAIQFQGEDTAVSYNNLDPCKTSDLPALNPGPNTDVLRGGLGVVLYDRAAYNAQGFARWDAQTLNRAYTDNLAAGDTSEAWLDANGTLLLINRYNGTLLRGD